jgi:outer membrane protein
MTRAAPTAAVSRPARAAIVALLLTGSVHGTSHAQTSIRDVETVAREYVATALNSNLALRGQQLEVERAEAALAAARGRFLPELALQARYTRTDGGREIDFPIGALLNPAYQTLNEMLAAQGQPPRFAPLSDVSIPFQREREQDTRITLRQPLYQPAIPAARRAQSELLRGSRHGEQALAQQLRRDVYTAYLDWLKALRVRDILESTRGVLGENLRVNESLLRNGRITEDQVLRAQTELLNVTQQLREAQSTIDQARSYVNFLLNRPLTTELEDARIAVAATPSQAAPTEAALQAQAQQHRPELQQLDALAGAAEAQQRIARAALLPTLSLGVDAGTQGESYHFGPGHNFTSASLVLSWKFFDGGVNRSEAQRARLAARKTRLQQEALAQQIDLEVQQASDRLAASQDSLAVAEARAVAARAALRIAERKRDAGSISQVEFLDARSALTAADLTLNVTRFELLERRVELQYATGAGTQEVFNHE